MKSVYVVFASCGEYSDRREWIVAAYPTREQAEAHEHAAEAEAERLGELETEDGDLWAWVSQQERAALGWPAGNRFDPDAPGLPGTTYCTLEVPFALAFDGGER